MKKILIIIFLSLALFSNVFADDLTVNKLLQQGFKITKDELTKNSSGILKIVTLTKGKQYVVCTISISRLYGPEDTICISP